MIDQHSDYYSLLKVARNADTGEIIAAYQKAKSAFSKTSVATYTLFDDADTEVILKQLEEAYQTLTNIQKRVEYDRQLRNQTEAVAPQRTISMPVAAPETFSVSEVSAPGVTENPSIPNTETYSGQVFKDIREAKNLSIDDVARITKIPVKFLRALERDDMRELPARVYIQGFIKNMATLYKLNPQHAAKSYLQYQDTKTAVK